MSDPSDDGVDRRLRAADPVPSAPTILPSGRTVAELLEDTMSIDLNGPPPATRSRPWRLVAVAAVVAAALLAGGIYLLARHDPAGQPTAHRPPTVLNLAMPKPPSGPAGPGAQSCIQFSAETLAPMQVAFSGTVTTTSADEVTITVDHWYRGGNADEVRLAIPESSGQITSLEGWVELVEGHRYLVTANDGVVTTCGFTAEWTQDLADTFHAAFES